MRTSITRKPQSCRYWPSRTNKNVEVGQMELLVARNQGRHKICVQGCFKCQQNKVQHQKKTGELHPLEIPQGPWQEISIDIIGLLPKSNRKDTIMVIVDRFTKIIRLKVTMTNISSEEITKIYPDEI